VANNVVWVDIPVVDLDRALTWYSAVMGKTVAKQQMGEMALGLFPHEGEDNGGCLFSMKGETPSATGILIYLNVQGRLDDAVAAVEKNGGKIVQPKHQIGPHGYRAVVLDSEGNRVALHSM
jgi:uncharacterized protein